MERYCARLVEQLQNDLAACEKSNLSCREKAEYCFGLAVKKWRELREKLMVYQFPSEKKEIEFFKTLKPRVTSEIEYYNLVYHSILFRPEEGESLLHFWGREYGRLRRFEAENKLFLQCYRGDESKLNAYFFLRKYYSLRAVQYIRIYDSDACVSTSGDWPAATLLALIKYRDYTMQKLERL